MKIQKSKINIKEALDELSINAFYLLNYLYHYDGDAKEEVMLKDCKFGKSTYKKAKAELQELGYLDMHQVGRHSYKYIVGKDKIAKHGKKYEVKALIDSAIESKMILERRELTEAEKEEVIKDAMEIYNNEELKRDLTRLQEVNY